MLNQKLVMRLIEVHLYSFEVIKGTVNYKRISIKRVSDSSKLIHGNLIIYQGALNRNKYIRTLDSPRPQIIF